MPRSRFRMKRPLTWLNYRIKVNNNCRIKMYIIRIENEIEKETEFLRGEGWILDEFGVCENSNKRQKVK